MQGIEMGGKCKGMVHIAFDRVLHEFHKCLPPDIQVIFLQEMRALAIRCPFHKWVGNAKHYFDRRKYQKVSQNKLESKNKLHHEKDIQNFRF